MSNKLIIYTDGGARGNPGPAAIGAVIGSEKFKEYIGIATNNIAEYKAVVLALKNAKRILGSKANDTNLEIYLDSELLYKQFRGEYRVKEPHLKLLFIEVNKLKDNFKNINFNFVTREKNKEADKLVNQVLDEVMN